MHVHKNKYTFQEVSEHPKPFVFLFHVESTNIGAAQGVKSNVVETSGHVPVLYNIREPSKTATHCSVHGRHAGVNVHQHSAYGWSSALEIALPQLQASADLALVDISIIRPSATNLMNIHSVARCTALKIINIIFTTENKIG
jgi:hypothetical protein